ncbi:MAG TPA: nucleotidyltransferase family protein [Rubricoccaceae bacterium]|jgi:hypothetical protein
MTATTDLATARARLAALLLVFQARYDVRAFWVFGSYACGEQTAESDLDVMVDFNQAPDLNAFVEIGLDLEEELGLRVNLVMREGLKPRTLPPILRDLVPV